ncbi:MAG: hypothetical protein GXO60_02085 [Epsilonproteobacteria bacterium]|nr:hypothetical protein [Campylobacterota bacterium]
MFNEMVSYHSILIYLTIVLLGISILIPFMTKEREKIVKRMRIYMFFIHSFITMVAFSGLVAFIFAKMDFDLSIFTMIVVYISITMAESVKYIKMLKASEISEMRAINIKYTLLSILQIVALIGWKLKEHKDAVPIS